MLVLNSLSLGPMSLILLSALEMGAFPAIISCITPQGEACSGIVLSEFGRGVTLCVIPDAQLTWLVGSRTETRTISLRLVTLCSRSPYARRRLRPVL